MKSIRSRILTFAILATLIPALGLGVLSFWRYQQLINENVTLELRALADYTSSELALWYRERVNEMRALSTSNTVIDGLSAAAQPRTKAARIGARELEFYLRSVQKKLDTLQELTVTDTGGRVVASSEATPTPITLPEHWSNAAITERVVPEPPRWDPARAMATLTVVVPILSSRNELLGALAAVLDLGKVRPRVQKIAKASLAELILLAPIGTPLLSTHAVATELKPLAAETLKRLRAAPRQPMVYVGHHQREVLGLADAPRSLPIVVVAETDRAEAYAAWLKLLQLFLWLVGGLALLVGIIAYWMGHSIVAPLNRLTAAAHRIADGDLSVQLRVADDGEIGYLTQVFNKMADGLRRSHAEVESASQALQKHNQLLETLSVTDSLTGLYNRKKLDDILADELARFRRNHRPFAVLMLDIDNFKAFNDTYGHLVGDEILVNVAAILERSVRSVDYVARYGGEEFVVVLVETTADAAAEVAERIRAVVETPRPGADGQPLAVTVSVGVTDSRENDGRPEEVLARADSALYEAKNAGRNRVQRAG